MNRTDFWTLAAFIFATPSLNENFRTGMVVVAMGIALLNSINTKRR